MDQLKVVVVSQRERPDGYGQQPGYVCFSEAEDVLVATTQADVAMVDRSPNGPAFRLRRGLGRVLRRTTGSTAALPPLPGQRRLSGPKGARYDLAVLVGFTIWDLPLLERLYDLRRRCERVVAWFPEVWPSELADTRIGYEPFAIVDDIFVGVADAAPGLSQLLGRPVHYLPMAADVARFAALAPAEPRPIDVLGIGRRQPRLHDALLEWSRKSSKLYLYDTLSGPLVLDPRAHRENLADNYRRSSVAITHFAKFDQPEVITGLRELPGRIWEGLASGVVMVGAPPDETLQRHSVGDSVVIELPTDPHEAVELIDELHRGPVTAIRRRNIELALRRNDWAHRWQVVFDTAGLPVPLGLRARIDRLAEMAAMFHHDP